MKTICIIGSGYFGRLAIERLRQNNADTQLIIVDIHNNPLEKVLNENIDRIHQDGIEYLVKNLDLGLLDWIIPAAPIHLAAEWCLRKLSHPFKRIYIPDGIEQFLPSSMRGKNQDIYVSHATFRCPDSCDEPEEFCTVTRKPRKENMFTILLKPMIENYTPIVIRSHQLAPGIGGYQPKQLWEALEKIKKSTTPVLLSTACRCHGVITGIGRSGF